MCIRDRATDAKTRQEAYNKCFDIISEEVPLYPLFHKKVCLLYTSRCV